MIIGVDIREFERGKTTGIGQYLSNFLSARSVFRAEDKFILYGNQKTAFQPPEGDYVVRIIPERFTFWWDQVLLPWRLSRDRVDVFLSPYYKAPLLVPCPVVITIHDLLFLKFPQRRGIRHLLYNMFFHIFARAVISKASAIITDSQHSKKDILKTFKVPAEKVKVVALGVPKRFQPVREKGEIESVKGKYNINKRYILYVGNFKPHKNVPFLIEAYQKLPLTLRKEHQLVLAGDGGSGVKEVKKKLTRMGLESAVVVTGLIPFEDLPLLYGGAEIFVFPSLYEGFGLPVVEAMACGVPVVSSDAASLPEIIGDAGVLFSPNRVEDLVEAMTSLLLNHDRRKDLAEKGLNRSRLFHPGSQEKKIREIIMEVYRDWKERQRQYRKTGEGTDAR